MEKLEALLKEENSDILGYGANDEVVVLAVADIVCVTVEDGRVIAVTNGGQLKLRQRLYQLEEILGDSFVKINQSCLVRVSEIERFETSFAGALKIKLKNGFKDYVSRRQMKAVKERLGL